MEPPASRQALPRLLCGAATDLLSPSFASVQVNVVYRAALPEGGPKAAKPMTPLDLDSDEPELPIVIIIPGAECPAQSYLFLAQAIAMQTRSVVALPAAVSYPFVPPPALPVIDATGLSISTPPPPPPTNDDGSPSPNPHNHLHYARGIATVLKFLLHHHARNDRSPFHRRLDFSRVFLLGHSMGGAAALQSMMAADAVADACGIDRGALRFCGVASYAGHALGRVKVGPGDQGAWMDQPRRREGRPPVLLIEAERDAVVAGYAGMYADTYPEAKSPTEWKPVKITFDRWMEGDNGAAGDPDAGEPPAPVFYFEVKDATHTGILKPNLACIWKLVEMDVTDNSTVYSTIERLLIDMIQYSVRGGTSATSRVDLVQLARDECPEWATKSAFKA